jgi:acyl dehydratase
VHLKLLLFVHLQARFASHVFPGDTLRIEVWKQEAPEQGRAEGEAAVKIVFRATTAQRGKAVLTHAAAELVARQPKAQQQHQHLHSAKL